MCQKITIITQGGNGGPPSLALAGDQTPDVRLNIEYLTRHFRDLKDGKGLIGCEYDKIGRFIALWATSQSLWQQLFCQNCAHFCKDGKIFHFSSEIILGNF